MRRVRSSVRPLVRASWLGDVRPYRGRQARGKRVERTVRSENRAAALRPKITNLNMKSYK